MENEIKIRPLKARRDILTNLEKNYWDDVTHAKENGKLVVYGSVIIPQEILRTMGFVPVGGENLGATYASKKASQKFIEVAETRGFTNDLCSYAKTQIGSLIVGDGPLGKLPMPDLIVADNNFCSSFKGWFETIRPLCGNPPLILFDIPPIHDNTTNDEHERIVKYVEEQLKDFIVYLEQLTGRRLNWDDLQERITNTGLAARVFLEFEEACRIVPAPITTFDVFLQMFPILCLRGNPETVDYFKTVKEEVLERIAEKFSVVQPEKYRLYWDGIAVWTSLKEQFLQLAKHGAALVSAGYPRQVVGQFQKFDGSKPLESIARSWVGNRFNQGQAYQVNFVSNLIRKYSVDGIIMQVSRTCKPSYLGQYTTISAVSKILGVPYVEVGGDMADPRLYSQDEVDAKIESFLEIMDQNAGRRVT